MKKIIRPFAAIALAAALAFSSGCGEDTSWSYKTDVSTLSNGNWIYYTYSQYETALSKISESNTDAEASGSSDVDISKEKIDNKDALDWIYAEAKKDCITQLTYEKLAKDNGIKAKGDDYEQMETQYKQMYESYMSTAFEKLGISSDSYIKASLKSNYLKEQIFLKLYDKDGSQAVSDDELNQYFTDNYTNYFYIDYSLKMTDSDGNTTDVSDEDKEKMQTNFNKYANMINKQGKTTADVVEQYMTDTESTADPSTTGNVILDDNTSLSDNLKKEIKDLPTKKAVVKTIDNTMYLLYKDDISNQVKNIKSDDEIDSESTTDISRTGILHEMKDDDYDKYIEEQKKSLDYKKNDACMSKYTVQRTVDIVKSFSAES